MRRELFYALASEGIEWNEENYKNAREKAIVARDSKKAKASNSDRYKKLQEAFGKVKEADDIQIMP